MNKGGRNLFPIRDRQATRFLTPFLALAVATGCATNPFAKLKTEDVAKVRKEHQAESMAHYDLVRSTAQLTAARTAISSGDYDTAQRRLNELLRSRPEHREGLLLAAELNMLSGQAARGVEFAHRAVKLDSRDAEAQHMLGLCQEAAGDEVGATASFAEAARLNPQDGVFQASYETSGE